MDVLYNGLMSECVHLDSLSHVVGELASFKPSLRPHKSGVEDVQERKARQKQWAFNNAFVEFFRFRSSMLGFTIYKPNEQENRWKVDWEQRFWNESGLAPAEHGKCAWLASQPRRCSALILCQYYKLVASKFEPPLIDDISSDDDDEEPKEELTVTVEHDSGELMDAGCRRKGVVRVVRRKGCQPVTVTSTLTSTTTTGPESSRTGTQSDVSSNCSQASLSSSTDTGLIAQVNADDLEAQQEAWNEWKRDWHREHRQITMSIDGKILPEEMEEKL